MTSISRRIKQLAKDTQCGLIRCSQLRRPDTGLKNQVPSVHHLRDSGSLEQDSHVVLLINRSEDDGTREIIIGKNKDGPTGTIKLRWDSRVPMFRSMRDES
jgi:replicative DNA helicase